MPDQPEEWLPCCEEVLTGEKKGKGLKERNGRKGEGKEGKERERKGREGKERKGKQLYGCRCLQGQLSCEWMKMLVALPSACPPLSGLDLLFP
eukprot:scaffold21447_cov17-Tisochrysis_lutea.AAC.1